MKPKPAQILIFFIALIISCKQKSFNKVSLKPEILESYYLVSEKLNNSKIVNPFKLFDKDSFLIITENWRIPTDLPLIHIFRKDPFTYINSKGKNGYGPFEIPSADVYNPRHSDSTFLMYSGMESKYVEYNIYDSSWLGIREFKTRESETPLGLVYFLPDSIFVGMSTYDKNKFLEVNLQGKKINGYGEWEQIDGKKEMSYFHHFNLNNGWFKTDDDFTLFVNASIFRDRLEIFNIKTKEIKTIDGPSGELPEFNFYEASMPLDIPISNPYRYRDVYISNKRIYALYGGLNEAHFKETSELAMKIFVFTRKGEPLFKFDLDRSIRSLVVDERLNKIYGLTTDENPGIAVFEIPSEVFQIEKK